MARFSIVFFAALFLACNVSAQTPQQLEMLKNRDNSVSNFQNFEDSTGFSDVAKPSVIRKGAVYYDEKTGKTFIPQNPNPKNITLSDGSKVAIPMAKTDEEIMLTRAGPDSRILRKMDPKQINDYARYIAEDRIFVMTSEFRVVTTVSGMKYCQLRLTVKNNTPRRLNKIRITYAWDDVKTAMTFSDINVLDNSVHDIAMAGSVCDRITDGAKYTIDTCSMEGLTEEQCRLRIAEL